MTEIEELISSDGSIITPTFHNSVRLSEKNKPMASFGVRQTDYFGYSVAVHDNTFMIGSYFNNNIGAAYVFENENDEWKQTAKSTASDGETLDAVGFSFAIQDNVILDGAPSDSKPGSVYLFERPANGWSDRKETAKLMASDGALKGPSQINESFGYRITMNDDTVIIGDP